MQRRTPRRTSIHAGQTLSGWLFTLPAVVILGTFLFVPIVMALWVSVSDWGGRGSPFSPDVSFVGLKNYQTVLAGGGLAEKDFGIALKNNAWYVLLVVPTQTALALILALLVNRARLWGRGFFRTAYYFPSVSSTVAISVLWLFLFSANGAVNKILSWFGIIGPNWFADPSGVFANLGRALGIETGPSWLTEPTLLGLPLWDWLGGPSVAMTAIMLMAIFTTSGVFMLYFIASLQTLSSDVDEAAKIDGANNWQRFWHITLPRLRTALFTVVTLGMIGCWQVFDSVYTATQGGPAKTTLTPAYLSYQSAFTNQQWGQGAAIAFLLFVIIIVFTLIQRWLLAERRVSKRRIRAYAPAKEQS